MKDQKMYMNLATGSVETRECWFYQTEEGQTVNAVDLGEVVEVFMGEDGWVQV